MLEIVSVCSSIATLILFIFYFWGRVWTINLKKKEKLEKFDVEYVYDTDIEEKKNEYNLGGNEQLKIVSENAMNWIKAYKVEYDGTGNEFAWDKEPLCVHTYLQAHEPIYFNTMIPEGVPNLGIKFERSDYIQGSFIVGYDGRYGGVHPVDYHLENTIKSKFYYILK